MPPNSEIEKLERRWKENPKGTVFAPYAEVLRKHGDYPLAKDILRQGLELHPDHIPGNIVLGRCCLDLGEEGPAEAAFVHVLELDQENVIALKALADITERQGRLMEAANWLGRLVAVDPSNDEARDQLGRVNSAREKASAALAVAPPPPPPPPSAETTQVVAVIQPPTPKSLEPPSAITDTEEIPEIKVGSLDADAIDEVLSPFDSAPSLSPAAAAQPAPPPPLEEPAAIADLMPGHLDLAAAASVEAQPLIDLTPDEAFVPPPTSPPSIAAPDMFAVGAEDHASIDLRSTNSGEFQSADDSTSLLDLSPAGSEFQQANASEELRVSGTTPSEYQTPSGAEELLKAVQSQAAPPAAPPLVEPPASEAVPPVTTGFAAITVMPTEELATPASKDGTPAEPAPAMSVVDMLAAAGSPTSGQTLEPAAPAPPDERAARPSELHLIFPDDAEPEPPRVRRISDEIGETPPAEPPVGEPAPVMTETMAELYARQGHLAEALNVYRVLAARQPNDSRIAVRIRELEISLTSGARRLSYVAVDTGGESVESFFRSLIDARPAGGGAPNEAGHTGSAAPTRPANDPLSLSAIFGEESAATPPAPVNDTPRPNPPDSFSFDQFFGSSGGSSGTGQQPQPPSDEDLDQFQNWLKSLKR